MIYRLKEFLLRILGDIKVYKFPFFMIYDPSSFKVKGAHTRAAINLLQPGDIVLRKYVAYLDGFFIPGSYSHTGIYVGDNTIIHAIAEGVQKIDIIDFLRCDGFCILRPKGFQEEAMARLHTWLGMAYDFEFKSNNSKFYCHELGVHAYNELDIAPIPVTFLGHTLKKIQPKYLADSFLRSPDFIKIYEYK